MNGRCSVPDIASVHSALGYIATAWIALNLGIIIGAWWAAAHVERGQS